MTPDRLDHARASGLPDLTGARTLVLRARADLPHAGLGAVTAVQGFRPEHDRLAARGVDVHAQIEAIAGGPGARFDAALVQITRARDETFALIAAAVAHVAPGGLIAVDGQKDEGIETVVRALRRVGGLGALGVASKSHGKLIWFDRPAALPPGLSDWAAAPQRPAGDWITALGGFSPGGPDTGSMLLAEFLPPLSGQVADLGAGWGYLSACALADHPSIDRLHLVEAEHAALAAARVNVKDTRARFHWADATGFAPATNLDAVICNPPFHAGRTADPGLGTAFIHAAARCLGPQGRLILVANRHLPYEAPLREAFTTGALLAEAAGFKLYQADRPRTAQPRKLASRA